MKVIDLFFQSLETAELYKDIIRKIAGEIVDFIIFNFYIENVFEYEDTFFTAGYDGIRSTRRSRCDSVRVH